MIAAVGRLVLRLPECHSLKEKRSVLRRLQERGRTRHRMTLREVGDADLWQRALLGFALVEITRDKAQAQARKLAEWVTDELAASANHVEFAELELLVYGDEPMGARMSGIGRGAEDNSDWLPREWREQDES